MGDRVSAVLLIVFRFIRLAGNLNAHWSKNTVKFII